MSGLVIPLPLTPGKEAIAIRTICGNDEINVEDTSTSGLLKLLDSLIARNESQDSIIAKQIVTADRDRLLAILYISLYGQKIESTITCAGCKQPFDLSFQLNDLLNHCEPQQGKQENYEIEPGVSFRLPTGEDEMLLEGLSAQQAERLLLVRCIIEGNPDMDKEKIELTMARVAPVLNQEMDATCPECNHPHKLQFDIQSFFLTKLKQERPLLLREIHSIASTYHWSQREILNLPRHTRKQFVSLIQSEN